MQNKDEDDCESENDCNLKKRELLQPPPAEGRLESFSLRIKITILKIKF